MKVPMGKRYFKYGIQMFVISAMSNILYGYATLYFGNFWIVSIWFMMVPLGVIAIWALFSCSMFFVRYGMIRNNRPCNDCPLKETKA